MAGEIGLEAFQRRVRAGERAILLVRHAERPQMDPDDPTFGDGLKLTAEGVRTARELGVRLAEFRDDVAFFASPLTRTRMTAELIAEGMGCAGSPITLDGRLGNETFYYDDPSQVLEVFQPGNFFRACFDYFRTGEQRGFKNLQVATDLMEGWLFERFQNRLMIVATHDCYIAAFLAARQAIAEFTCDNWIRFLDGGAILVRPDGTRDYVLVRTGLSEGICGVGGKVVRPQ